MMSRRTCWTEADMREITVADIATKLDALLAEIDKDAATAALPLTGCVINRGTEDVDGTLYWMEASIRVTLNSDHKLYRERGERERLAAERAAQATQREGG